MLSPTKMTAGASIRTLANGHLASSRAAEFLLLELDAIAIPVAAFLGVSAEVSSHREC